MKKILLFLFTVIVISLSGSATGYTAQSNQPGSSNSSQFYEEEYTYVDVYIGGKHYIYVYSGDLLIDVYEVEE